MLIQIGTVAFALIFFISGAHATDNGQWKGYQLAHASPQAAICIAAARCV
jgi:hypothetical protein